MVENHFLTSKKEYFPLDALRRNWWPRFWHLLDSRILVPCKTTNRGLNHPMEPCVQWTVVAGDSCVQLRREVRLRPAGFGRQFSRRSRENWWRRRESNPRPKTFTRSLYMLIRFQFFSPPSVRSRQGADGNHPLYLASHPGRDKKPARL